MRCFGFDVLGPVVLKRQVSGKVFRALKATAVTKSSTSVVLSRVHQILF
jgi:hypothetical protein